MLSGCLAQRQRCPRRQQPPGRSSLCLPNASRARLCESAFVHSNQTAGRGRRLSGHGAGDDVGNLVRKGQPVSWGWSRTADLQSAPSRVFAHYRRTPLVCGGEVNKPCELCLPFSLVLSPPPATGGCDKLAPGEGMKAMRSAAAPRPRTWGDPVTATGLEQKRFASGINSSPFSGLRTCGCVRERNRLRLCRLTPPALRCQHQPGPSPKGTDAPKHLFFPKQGKPGDPLE